MNGKHAAAYFKERFPPVNMMLFAILFFTVYSVARCFTINGETSWYNKLLGVLATISFFYRLRVFDEVKDYETDVINHPGRVLQSGRVTIRQLTAIAAPLLVVELAWSLACGRQTFLCWSGAAGFSLLMRYEFFAGRFLKKHLLLYSFTHLLVMPLVIVWIWSAYVYPVRYSLPLLLLCLLSLAGGYSFELARKIHAPVAERKTVDSYSRSIGFTGSILCVWTCLLAGIVAQTYLLDVLHTRLWPVYLLGLLFAATLVLYVLAIRGQQEKQLRMAEKGVSLFMLISYVSLIVEIKLH